MEAIIRERSKALFEKVKAYREHMHRNPELSYQEFETMEYVADQLAKIGIPFEKGVAGTGVVAIIRNDQHAMDQSCVGLRSELDALPIYEQNNCAYTSRIEG
ncbi:MAG: amidohydrolase, partial [Fluviicola sp.]|nr:amidohydrolase [Fluviicola sp.]